VQRFARPLSSSRRRRPRWPSTCRPRVPRVGWIVADVIVPPCRRNPGTFFLSRSLLPHDPGTAPRWHRLIGVKGPNPGLSPVEQAKIPAWATAWLRDTSAIVRTLPHRGGAGAQVSGERPAAVPHHASCCSG
jgi:hypothetical protein